MYTATMSRPDRLARIEGLLTRIDEKVDSLAARQAAQSEQIKSLFASVNRNQANIEGLERRANEVARLEARILRLTVAGLGAILMLLVGIVAKVMIT